METEDVGGRDNLGLWPNRESGPPSFGTSFI